jgi:predicted regulator of Ras-like GTPase activity (Roadblock/LC7/MglB family)
MLGLFKKMLSKSESVPATPFAKPASAPVVQGPKPSGPVPARAIAAPPRPLHTPVQSVPPSRTFTPSSDTSNHVQVALAAIAAGLPESISHKVPASPEQFIAIPVDKVLPQLAHGMVIMTVSELLECAPESFAALAGTDDLQVTLPLADIVKQLSPEHFTRRSQKRVEIPEEVTSVFAAGIAGVSISKPAAAQPTPIVRQQPAISATTVSKQSTTTAGSPQTNPSGKIAMSPQALAALGAKPTSAGTPAFIAKVPSVGEQKPISMASSAPLPKSATTAPAAKKPAFGGSKITGELAVPLSFVCNEWADEVRAQLAGVVVADAQIQVPLELLQSAMQSGKVLFSWQQVASWIRPPLAIPPTQKVGEMAVEFPLKVVAPLFMAHHRAATQKRVAVDQTIPDLFGGGNGNDTVRPQVTQPSPPSGATKKDIAPGAMVQRHAPAQPANQQGMRAPVTRSLDPELPSVVQPTAKNHESLEQIVGTPEKRFNAKEIVANTSRLPNVAGVLLAMSDGLLVTSHTPPQMRAETIAAFLPQMFGRMNQYTKELALGPLQQLTLGVESGQWNVFKGEAIYFAVLGKRGETLPLNLLAQVAAELSSQSK